jgi:hypothetical protein
MKTKQTYDFNVNNTQMMGGANETAVCTNNDIRHLQVQIDSLINRVKTLEDKLSPVNNPEKPQQNTQQYTQLPQTQQLQTQQLQTQPLQTQPLQTQPLQTQQSQLNMMTGGAHNNFNVNLARRFI